MSRKVNFLRVIIFSILLISPVIGLFYGNSDGFVVRIMNIFLYIWFAPFFIFQKLPFESKIILIIVQLLWIFFLATIFDKVFKFLYRYFKRRKNFKLLH